MPHIKDEYDDITNIYEDIDLDAFPALSQHPAADTGTTPSTLSQASMLPIKQELPGGNVTLLLPDRDLAEMDEEFAKEFDEVEELLLSQGVLTQTHNYGSQINDYASSQSSSDDDVASFPSCTQACLAQTKPRKRLRSLSVDSENGCKPSARSSRSNKRLKHWNRQVTTSGEESACETDASEATRYTLKSSSPSSTRIGSSFDVDKLWSASFPELTESQDQTTKDQVETIYNARLSPEKNDYDPNFYFPSQLPAGTPSPLEKFFSQYSCAAQPPLTQNPSQPLTQKFHALRSINFAKLSDGNARDNSSAAVKERRRVAKLQFSQAAIQEFNGVYGIDIEDIRCWRTLCRDLQISPIPDELEDCRQVVANTHVNIFDFLGCRYTNLPPCIYETVEALSTYTKSTGLFFPQRCAETGGVLRFLLRQIMHPGGGRSKRKRRR